ncbi:MAG: GHKL domain-containing protein [Bacteroidales bacterium]|nr:GHKL domain-containing protein [Bacteroidales bacterium]MCM1416595.1 GHKL domain-containing protein [bacterium]MCM1424817.1 GHKL domain-containing protein [bacterium]
MSEMRLLPIFIYLVDSIVSGFYVMDFLKGKYSKRVVLAAWSAAWFFVQIVVFEIIGGRFPINKVAEMILDLSILLFMQSVFFQKEMQKQFFTAFSFVAGKETVKYMVHVFAIGVSGLWDKILSCFVAEEAVNTVEKALVWIKLSNLVFVALCILLYSLLLCGYLFLVRGKFVKKDYPLQKQENIFLILPCIAALCISALLKIVVLSVENGMTVTIYDTVPATKFLIPVICTLLLFSIIAGVVLFQKLVQYNEETGKCAMLENQMRQMQREVAEIQDIYADMRGLRHDMRSHMANVSLLVRSAADSGQEELESYISKMEETVSRLDFTYQTGNPITDVIIHRKGQEAEKKQIRFQVDFTYPPRLQIDVYDVAVILNNVLENAIEACGRMKCSDAAAEKQIKLFSYVKGNLFFIEAENDFSEKIVMEKESGLPMSNKANGRLHGLGLSNIRRCARKYQGDIDITISDTGGRKKFTLTVMMNGKPAAEA